MNIKDFIRKGWVRCPECGTEPEQTRPDSMKTHGGVDWTWKFECPNCGEAISGRIHG